MIQDLIYLRENMQSVGLSAPCQIESVHTEIEYDHDDEYGLLILKVASIASLTFSTAIGIGLIATGIHFIDTLLVIKGGCLLIGGAALTTSGIAQGILSDNTGSTNLQKICEAETRRELADQTIKSLGIMALSTLAGLAIGFALGYGMDSLLNEITIWPEDDGIDWFDFDFWENSQ